jgi:outer membrane protein
MNLSVLAILVAALTADPHTPAGSYATPDYIRRPPSLPANRDASRALRLTLAEAIETSMRRNLAINLQREQVRQVDTAQGIAMGAFEPRLDASIQRDVSRSPPLTRQEGVAGDVVHNERTSFGFGLFERLPTGTELRLGFGSNVSQGTAGTAVLQDRYYRSELSGSLTQPLLAGFSFTTRIQRAPLLRARFGSQAAREQARLRALLTVNLTENTYWDLVAAMKSYEVTAGALDLARRQLELTRRQIAAGTTPESDLISAEATLAQRELALVRAEAQIDEVSDRLRGLLNLPEPEWERPLLPADTPSFVPLQVAVGPAFERALAGRPELRGVQIDYQQIALDLAVARNARLPRLDLQVAGRTVGQDPLFGETVTQVTRADGRQWTVGLNLAWAPIGTAARAEVRRVESALRSNALNHEQIVVAIRTEIREAVRAIDTADRQLRAAARSRELSERSLDVEQRRYASGLSNNFFIAQRQSELEAARQAELNALIQHEKATSDMQLATGDLLDARHLVFSVDTR